MIDPKDVTIIIPHLGATPEQKYSLKQCITSLLETVDVKIIIALNNNDDASDIYGDIRLQGELDEKYLKNVSTLALSCQGQCKAVNAAVATTNTEWIFITNDDMVFCEGWFEKLVEPLGIYMPLKELKEDDLIAKPFGKIEFSDHPLPRGIMCISPRLVEPRPGAPTFEVFFAGGAGGDFSKENWLGYAEEHAERQYQIQTGFNFPILIKRELWDTIGGYDINYDPWGSNGDSDLQAKIHLTGVQPYQNPNSIVYHFGMTSGTSHPGQRPFWEKNWHYFIEKWGFERASSPDVWNSVNIINYEKLKYHPAWEGKYGKV